MRTSGGDARQNAFVVAIFQNTSPVYSVVQVYGEAIHRCHSKWRHDSAPMNQSSTAGYRLPVHRTETHGKSRFPPGCPGTGSGRCATSHPHAQNPAALSPPDGMHPGTGCNSPSHRVQSAVRSGAAHSGTGEFHPDRPATRAGHSLSAAAGPPRSARADHRDDCGPAPQSPPASVPAASLPAQYENTPPALRRYSRRAGTVRPPGCLSRSRTTPLAHTAGHAPESLIQSVS
ncbi:hypothetical protein BvCmsOUP061_04956 [Escherichia coli]|nr:hypothetical protein BvCmsOUP061_04956 [Escherichia coli]